jgi:hypothetical protein
VLPAASGQDIAVFSVDLVPLDLVIYCSRSVCLLKYGQFQSPSIEDYLQGRSIVSIDKKIPSTSMRASPQTGFVIERLLAAIVPSGDVWGFPASLNNRA